MDQVSNGSTDDSTAPRRRQDLAAEFRADNIGQISPAEESASTGSGSKQSHVRTVSRLPTRLPQPAAVHIQAHHPGSAAAFVAALPTLLTADAGPPTGQQREEPSTATVPEEQPKPDSETRLQRLRRQQEEALSALEQQVTGSGGPDAQYLTPLQRKEAEVRCLRRLLQEAAALLGECESELADIGAKSAAKLASAESKAAAEIQQLARELMLANDAATMARQAEAEARREVEQLRAESEAREAQHRENYLRTYKKGRDSVQFERQDELEKLAAQEPDRVTVDELLQKLQLTQKDLQRWQSVKLTETYFSCTDENGQRVSPHATESDAKLRFLRDSMYHYLTQSNREHGLQHLAAIIGIFSFTDVQMVSINKRLSDWKKKGKL